MNTTHKPFHEHQILSFDTETTGIDPFNDRVVTASMVLDYPEVGKTPAIKTWLIKPEVEISDEASAVHGITNEHAQANGVDAYQALQEIATAFNNWEDRGLPLVAYNVQFDATLLIVEFARYGIDYKGSFNKVIDPYVLDKHFDKYRKGKRQLAITAEHYGVKEFDAHDATGDSIAAAGIARAIGRKYKLNQTAEELFDLQVKVKYQQSVELQSYFRNTKGDKKVFVPTAWPYRTEETDKKDHLRDPIL